MSRRRLPFLLTFATALAGTWAARFLLAPAGSAPAREPVVPAFLEPRTAQVAGSGLVSGEDLYSVRSGVLRWPAGGGPEQVNAAFAEAWRKLRPLAEAGGRDGDDSGLNNARQLFADWWKVDPAGALRFVSDPPGVFTERGGIYLLPLVAARDPREAWKLIDLPLQQYDRMSARGLVLAKWAARDPHEALSFVGGLPASQRAMAERGVIRGWAAANAGEALAWVAAMPDGRSKNMFMEQAALGAAVADPAGLIKALRSGAVPASLLKNVTSGRDDNGETTALARAAIASDPDPQGFCKWAVQQGADKLAAVAWGALVERTGVKNADAVAGLAAGLSQNELAALCAGLGSAAPEAGFAWALAHGGPLQPLVKAWAAADPEAALTALRAAPQSPEITAAIRTAAAEAKRNAPVLALMALASLPPEGDARNAQRELHGMIKTAAVSDPVRTLEVMGTLPGVTPEQVSMVLVVGAHRDPQGTAAALARVELPVTDTVAAESFTRGWAISDPEAASVWVRGLKPGEMRDGAAAGLARSAAAADPPGALAWAVEVTEPDMRQRVLRTVIEAAVKANTPLDALLETPRLTPAERGTLRAHAASLTNRK